MSDEENKEPRKYAGKYDTVEQLEEGYKNAAKIYQENEELKKKVEESGKVPDSYFVPDDVSLDESAVNELRETAKTAQFSQDAFNRLARVEAHKRQLEAAKFQEARKAMSDEEYTVLDNYVKNHYAPPLVETALKKLIVDKEARKGALQHREQMLNSSVAGVGRPAAAYHVNKEDVFNAALAVQKAKTGREREAAKSKHIEIAAQFAAQKKRAS